MTQPTAIPAWRERLDRFAADRPDLVYVAPFLTYLALLALKDNVLPPKLYWLAAVIRGIGALAVFLLCAKYVRHWGRPHFLLALIVGVASATMWAAGQHWLNSIGVPQGLPLLMKPVLEIENPHTPLGDGFLLWSTILLRIAVACTTVPLIEELFWRGFLLRAAVDWENFERVPPGQFSWRAMIFTSLLSVAQHPANWVVSIVCWVIFNLLYYRTRSISCLILTHAITNLALYSYMVAAEDWLFW